MWRVPSLLLIVAVVVGVAFLLTDRIPPRSITATRMQVLKRRILRYAQAHGSLPPALSALPPLVGYNNELVDGWGHPIRYMIEADGTVALTSLGSDGKAGGSEDAADLTCRFPSKRRNGTWSDELVEWLPDSLPTQPTSRE